MKSRSMFFKLFLGNLLVMTIVVVLGNLVTFKLLDDNYQLQQQQSQDRLAQIALRHFDALWPLAPEAVDTACKTLMADSPARLTVIAPDGAVWGDSARNPRTMDNHRTDDRPEVIAALAGRTGADVRRSETLGVQFRYTALPMIHNGRVLAVIRVAAPITAIAEGETFFQRTLAWSAVVSFIAAALLGLLASWIWYAPLRRVSLTARQIAAGDLSRKAFGGSGELADLAKAVNEMRDSLVSQINLTESQQHNLQTVLGNLTEGVIALDAEARIVLMNAPAARLLNTTTDAALDQMLAPLAPSLGIIDLCNRALGSTKPVHGQIELTLPAGRRLWEGEAVRIDSAASQVRCLLVLRDVTELTNAAVMKTQFVANASHELRTPLATIRAAVDSISSVDPTDRGELEKIAGILDRHVARLESMTNDLLDLHRVESGKIPLQLQNLPLAGLQEWVKGQFDLLAQQKNVTLDIPGLDFTSASTGAADQAFRTDRKLLELILRNLVDNALKSTPPGGKVTCEIELAHENLHLQVADTGCGIAAQDQPRVFERFFQSDAARSGDRVRGTGLGLAIVKHAAERLSARIELQSELGRGTTIAVTIPPAKS